MISPLRRKAQQVLGELRLDAFDLLGARAHAVGHPVLAAQPVQDGPTYLGDGEGLEPDPLATRRAVGLYGVEQVKDAPVDSWPPDPPPTSGTPRLATYSTIGE